MPQRRRLLRAPDLATFRGALVDAAVAGGPQTIRSRALILPSRAAIELLRRAIEDRQLRQADAAVVLPLLLTRDDWVAELHASLPAAPRLLRRVEREVLIERAAAAVRDVAPPPFDVRPGLTAAMLDFYDELRRRGRTVGRFAEAVGEQLSNAEYLDDTGSEKIAQQTSFLVALFDEYERSVAAAGAIDEHVLRARLLAAPDRWRVSHVVVAVADHPSDPRGLWPADLDLLGRLTSVNAVDVLVTDHTHDAGFRERIDKEILELEDVRLPPSASAPVLVVPDTAPASALCAEYRDREEEIREVARAIRVRATRDSAAPLSRTAIVFQRPLPYLYLAQQVLGEAAVPFQAFDTLPLSAEPYAALLDLALLVARTGGTRDSALALARSPLLELTQGGAAVVSADFLPLARLLMEARVTAAPEDYPRAAAAVIQERPRDFASAADRILRAAEATAAIARDLRLFRDAETASAQVAALAGSLRRYERRAPAAARERHLRARSAVLSSLDALADAYRRHDDRPRVPDALSATIHHLIERQTFTPRQGTTGVHLVDAVAARFGAFDHVHIVGLVDAEWPERQRRNVFYTTGFLGKLGWPTDDAHLRAQQAAFRDLVRLPGETLSLSAFQLEGEAVVAPTPLADEARPLARVTLPAPDLRTFADERLAWAPVAARGLSADAAAWLALRQARPPLAQPAYRGRVGPQPPQEYRVSRLDRYAECAFKYFAGAVLRLDEEPDDDSAMTPRERGTLLHSLFETFYRQWSQQGRGAVTPVNVADAIEQFEAIVTDRLAALPEADRIIESSRLLGSIVTRGVAERVFYAEAEDPREVVERWLEYPLNGTYAFPPQGFAPPKTIAIRGIADRIDRFADGTLRLVDYKLTRAPGDRAVQLKVYGFAAPERLAREGRPMEVSRAEYISFGDDREPVTSIGNRNHPTPQAIEVGAQKFAEYVGLIEAGEFPPAPEKASMCGWCAFALVCRKESVAEDGDDAADAV